MFPTTLVSKPAALNISPASVVEVVFPFVPVMLMNFPFAKLYANSTSPAISTFLSLNLFMKSRFMDMPGDTITRSHSSSPEGFCPHLKLILSENLSRPDMLSASLLSYATVSTCLLSRNPRSSNPLFPSPITMTFIPFSSIIYIPPIKTESIPIRPIITVIISNTLTTLVSCHPHSSKW